MSFASKLADVHGDVVQTLRRAFDKGCDEYQLIVAHDLTLENILLLSGFGLQSLDNIKCPSCDKEKCGPHVGYKVWRCDD